MLYSLLYVVVRFLLEVLIVRGRSEARLRAEVLALRYQLAVLERQVGRPRWRPSDRLVLAAISRSLPRPGWRSLIPRPETLCAGIASWFGASGLRTGEDHPAVDPCPAASFTTSS